MDDEREVRLVYDRQCPVCRYYAGKIRLENGEVDRVDAREACAFTDELETLGYDLDEGMILQDGDQLFFGSDALHELALRSSKEDGFNRIMSRLFRSPRVAAVLYPLLTRLRRLLLRLLGRTPIKKRKNRPN